MPVSRRTFLVAGVGAGLASHVTSPEVAAAEEWVGRRKDELPTPALLLDLDAFEANLKTMADHCRHERLRLPAARQDAQVPGDRPAAGRLRRPRASAPRPCRRPRRWSPPASAASC